MIVSLRKRWAPAALALIMLLSGVAPAQSGRRLPRTVEKGDDEVKLGTSEVVLPVTVRNEYGHLVRGLRVDDFVILEDNKRQKVTSFSVEQVAVNVVLLLDASGSVFTEIPAIREAANRFTEQFTEQDKFAAVQFADKVEVIQDWTSNRDDIKHALAWKYKSGNSTLFYDALEKTCTDLLSKVEGRKVIILLTDGVDTESKTTMDRAFNAAVRAQATVYVVSKVKGIINHIQKEYGGIGGVLTGTSGMARLYIQQLLEAERRLAQLAEMTGGTMYSPIENADLKKAYRDVAEEIKGQYVITYISSNEGQDGRFRQIKVALSQAGYTAYSRQGYYAAKNP